MAPIYQFVLLNALFTNMQLIPIEYYSRNDSFCLGKSYIFTNVNCKTAINVIFPEQLGNTVTLQKILLTCSQNSVSGP